MSGILDNPALLIVLLVLLAIPVAFLTLTFTIGSRAASRHGPQPLDPPTETARATGRRGRTSREVAAIVLLTMAVIALLVFGYPVILIAFVGLASLPVVAQVTLALAIAAAGVTVWAVRRRRPAR